MLTNRIARLSAFKTHIEIGKDMVTTYDGTIYYLDLLATAVFQCSIMLITGFANLISDNFIRAAPLVRLQLDNYLRIFSLHRVDTILPLTILRKRPLRENEFETCMIRTQKGN